MQQPHWERRKTKQVSVTVHNNIRTGTTHTVRNVSNHSMHERALESVYDSATKALLPNYIELKVSQREFWAISDSWLIAHGTTSRR